MRNLKSDKGQPTAREQAMTRRVVDMVEVLGMRHMPTIDFEADERPVNPKAPISEQSASLLP